MEVAEHAEDFVVNENSATLMVTEDESIAAVEVSLITSVSPFSYSALPPSLTDDDTAVVPMPEVAWSVRVRVTPSKAPAAIISSVLTGDRLMSRFLLGEEEILLNQNNSDESDGSESDCSEDIIAAINENLQDVSTSINAPFRQGHRKNISCTSFESINLGQSLLSSPPSPGLEEVGFSKEESLVVQEESLVKKFRLDILDVDNYNPDNTKKVIIYTHGKKKHLGISLHESGNTALIPGHVISQIVPGRYFD